MQKNKCLDLEDQECKCVYTNESSVDLHIQDELKYIHKVLSVALDIKEDHSIDCGWHQDWHNCTCGTLDKK